MGAEALDQLRLPGGLGRAETGVQFWGSLLLAHGGEVLRERGKSAPRGILGEDVERRVWEQEAAGLPLPGKGR